ncbi:phage late control D family protein, partial [Pseudomonas viridiflava]|uniref:phage late control D family protein n=1 Tax=Pseudomonas viridiflava TaxID=33069 RepID=UPI0019824E2C
IITDQSQPLSPLTQQPVIRYHSASVTETSDSITEWSSNRVLQPGRLSIQTFDYKQPRNRLPVSMPSLNAQGNADSYEVYDFLDHYSHATPSDSEHLVRHRLEAIEVLAKSFKGSSNCRAMCPGYT